MFGYELVKKKVKEVVKAVITAEAFDGFFSSYATVSKDMAIVAVYASIRIISQTLAISPIKLYKESENGRKVQLTHPLTKLLRNPYSYSTYFNWIQYLTLNLAARGNAYALIIRDMNYNVTELIPLKWDDVIITEFINSNDYVYDINYAGKTLKVWHEDILHFKIMSEDGIRGINPIEVHRKTLDISKNETVYNESFYKQATNISGVIESEKHLDKNAVSEIKESFGANFGGAANAGKTAVLSDGKKYHQLQLLSPMDANYIESAKLSRSDIAVIFGVPLNKLGDLSQATHSNISEMNRDFYKSTLAPYYCAISQEMSLKLLTESELDDNLIFEFDTDILLSLSKKERYEIYAIGIRNGIINRNEARAAENLESKDELNEFLQESGVLTIAQANSNFNNSKGGDTDDTNNDDIKTDENDTDEVLALVKTVNDIKAEIGRLKTTAKSSSKETPNDDKGKT